jgi:Tol biopolymer transport system component
MKKCVLQLCRGWIVCWCAFHAVSLFAAAFQPVSVLDGSQPSPAGGGGDSYLPVISADGRYVLFASTANNLVVNTNGNPKPALMLPRLNVYLRDRTNGNTTLISVNVSGSSGGNGDSIPVQISTNGRYALFESSASDLAPNDTNGVSDVFLRDLVSGSTTLVSADLNGGVGNGPSRSSTMTPDGRYVAFVSGASNLVAGDTNLIPDVFVRDVPAGITTLASVGAISTNFTRLTSSSESPEITPDGRYVAFLSTATNLVAGNTNSGDVYVRDLVSGTTIWASVVSRALLGGANGISFNHAISADGNFVAYETMTNPQTTGSAWGMIFRFDVASGTTAVVHTNAAALREPYQEIQSLSMTPDGRFIAFVGNATGSATTNTAVYLWDGQNGSTTVASVDQNGQTPLGTCDSPVIDPTGRYIAFMSSATNLVTNSLAGDHHLYVRDLQLGATRLAAVDSNGVGSGLSPATVPSMSLDGRFVAFESPDAAFVANDRNRDYDVFARDLSIDSVELISGHDPALPSLTPNGPSVLSPSSVSSDGRFVAFASDADNLVANDTNGCRDVFARDRVAHTNFLVSVATNGTSADFISTEASISADGRYVAFTSSADNLVPNDTNGVSDVFLRDLQTGTTSLISVNTNGTGPGNYMSYSPRVSTGGRFVTFFSQAINLAPGIYPSFGVQNVFLRDVQLNKTYALSTNGTSPSYAMTPDGHYLAFGAAPRQTDSPILYLWDSLLASRVFTNSASGSSAIALSDDGGHLACLSSIGLLAIDRQTRSTWVVTTNHFPGGDIGLRFSADGHFLTYIAEDGLPYHLFVHDFQRRVSTLVSRGLNTGFEANNSGYRPAISGDGHFIIYRSMAADVVPNGPTNGIPQLYLFDRVLGKTILLTTSGSGSGAADNFAFAPLFSPDGQTLFFPSWASDLASGDFNHSSDVLAYTLLYVTATLGAGGQGPSLSWAAAPDTSYRVEYKDNVSDPVWHDLGASISIVGSRASTSDTSAMGSQRFYRVVAF